MYKTVGICLIGISLLCIVLGFIGYISLTRKNRDIRMQEKSDFLSSDPESTASEEEIAEKMERLHKTGNLVRIFTLVVLAVCVLSFAFVIFNAF